MSSAGKKTFFGFLWWLLLLPFWCIIQPLILFYYLGEIMGIIRGKNDKRD